MGEVGPLLPFTAMGGLALSYPLLLWERLALSYPLLLWEGWFLATLYRYGRGWVLATLYCYKRGWPLAALYCYGIFGYIQMILTSCGQSSLVDDLGSVCLPRLSVNTSLHDTEGTSMDTNTVRLYNVRYGHPSGYCPIARNKHPDSAYNKLQIEQCFDHTMKTDIIP